MIAERAGVSRGTVDRVLHGRPNVKPEIKERVQQIVRRSGYGAVASGEGIRIGVLLPGNNWFYDELKVEWLRGLHDAAQAVAPLGVEVELIECETDLPNEFAEKIEAAKRRGLDGLAISAKNNPVMRKLVDTLVSESIPVLTYNSDIPDSKRFCFVGQDLYRSGKVAADLIVKYVKPENDVLIVAGNLEVDAHKRRVDGFLDKCSEAGISREHLPVVECFNEYVLTYEKVREQLSQRPALRAIYMANESVAACAEAIARSGRTERIMVVGNDLTASTRRLLQDGAVDFIIEQNLYWQGYRPVMLLKELLLSPGNEIEPFSFTNISVINAENMR